MDEALDKKLRLALEQAKGDWQLIARKASVSHSWLSKFTRGEVPNPGYQTLLKVKWALDALKT